MSCGTVTHSSSWSHHRFLHIQFSLYRGEREEMEERRSKWLLPWSPLTCLLTSGATGLTCGDIDEQQVCVCSLWVFSDLLRTCVGVCICVNSFPDEWMSGPGVILGSELIHSGNPSPLSGGCVSVSSVFSPSQFLFRCLSESRDPNRIWNISFSQFTYSPG